MLTAEGLKRADGYAFESDEVAGEWFNGMFENKRVAGRLDDITAGLESMKLAESVSGAGSRVRLELTYRSKNKNRQIKKQELGTTAVRRQREF